MATTVYKKTALTGGAASALDSIDGNSLLDGDIAFVFTGTLGYFYHLNATSGAAESSPDVISPDTNAGTKRWILQDVQSGSGNPVLTNLLSNTQWIAMSGSTVCEATSGAAPVTDGANAALINNLLTNGGFDSDQTGWSAAQSASLSTVAGQTGNGTRVTNGAGAYGQMRQSITVTVGKLYKLSFYQKNGTATGLVQAGSTSYGSSDYYYSGELNNAGFALLSPIIFEATTTTIYLTFGPYSNVNTEYSDFDSITLYEITPGYVAADTLAPDGWFKLSGLQVLRQHNDGGTYTKDGSFYALKFTSITAADHMIWPLSAARTLAEHYQRFAGRTVTFGAWCWASTASHMFLQIVDSDTTDDDQTSDGSAYHTGGSGWEWLEVTMTVSASTTEFSVAVCFDSTTDAYFSQPMLVFGSSIGQGNYAPIPGEEILCQSNITLTGYTATTSAADGIINLEAASSGMIGKGVKAVLVKAYGKDSAAGDGVGFDAQSASGVEDGISVDTQVNNIRVQGQGWVKCDANGDIYFDHRGSGASALTIDIKVIGVRT